MTTPICVPLFVQSVDETLAKFRAAKGAGADMAELRADTAPLAVIEAVLRGRRSGATAAGEDAHGTLPVLVTWRSKAEGGRFIRTDADLAAGIALAAREGAEWIDVEFAAWERSEAVRAAVRNAGLSARPDAPSRSSGDTIAGFIQNAAPPKMVLSSHDFSGRPADLHERIARMAAVPEAAVVKVAWQAASIADGVEALALTDDVNQRHGKAFLGLAMGEFGQISRLLGAKFGQPFTFASLERGAESAPGQVTVAELRARYRWARQNPETAVCGVIGWPVGHSLSPHIHNAGFAAVGFDGVYVPLPVPPTYDAFAQTVDALRAYPGMHLRGLSVTIPHKENALRYVRDHGGQVDGLAARIGVVNTVVFGSGEGGGSGVRGQGSEGALRGMNSDYAGALDALCAAMGIARENLAGKRCAVLGAGGAARAIVAGLAAYGATVVVYNRTLARAQELAHDFNGHTGKVVAVEWGRLCASCCEVYINCTPLGMHPKVEACPIDFEPEGWGPDTVVFDTIYNPLRTKFLALAEARGAKVVTGMEMFVRQAAVQFEAFTGHPAPVSVFRQVMRERL